jgi:DNA-directed RNA polymerase specialized sigma24 family protein
MIQLSEEERQEVEGFIRRGKANARTLTRAHVLLKDAEGWTIARLSETFNVSPATVSVRLQSKSDRRGGKIRETSPMFLP